MTKLNSSLIDNKSLIALSSLKILSVLDFIEADANKIVTGTGLNIETVLNLKHKFTSEFSSHPISGYELFLESKNDTVIKSHISGLDHLLKGGLPKRAVLELCGPVGSGKTQICHAVAVNVATRNIKVDYVDTKLDFSATKCNNILPSNLRDKEMDRYLENIMVYKTKDIYQLISTLDSIKEGYRKNIGIDQLLILDSLTVPCLPLVNDSSSKGKAQLSYIGSILKEIASSCNRAVLITNLAVNYFDVDEEELQENSKKEVHEMKPLLGKYWLHTPNTRILIKRDSPSATMRTISILKSEYLKLNRAAEIDITDCGVI